MKREYEIIRCWKPIIATILAGLLLSGCFHTAAKEWTISRLATGVDWYCGGAGAFETTREETIAEINAETEVGDVTPLDCDSDGNPDF